jgi:hypothetical protein
VSETAQRKLHVRIRLVLPPALEEEYEPPPLHRRLGHLLKRHWPTVLLGLATVGTAMAVFGGWPRPTHRAVVRPARVTSAAAAPAPEPAAAPAAAVAVNPSAAEPAVAAPAGETEGAAPAPAAPADPAAVLTAQPPASPRPAPSVARVLFTSGVRKHEPTDRIERLTTDGRPLRVYCFTELRQMRGRTVVHRWEHEGEPVAQLRFDEARSERWRVYSSKVIRKDMMGSWQVVVTDGEGRELARTDPLRVERVSR